MPLVLQKNNSLFLKNLTPTSVQNLFWLETVKAIVNPN